jgi:hypothetical protein
VLPFALAPRNLIELGGSIRSRPESSTAFESAAPWTEQRETPGSYPFSEDS